MRISSRHRTEVDDLIAGARRTPHGAPLLSREELIEGLDRVDAGERIPVPTESSSINYLGRSIVMLSIIAATVLILLTLGGEEVKMKPVGASVALLDSVEQGEPVEVQSEVEEERSPEIKGGSTSIEEAAGVQLRTPKSTPPTPEQTAVPTTSPEMPGLFLQDLTPEELEDIFGLRVDDDGVRLTLVSHVEKRYLSRRDLEAEAKIGVDTGRASWYKAKDVSFVKGVPDFSLSENEREVGLLPAHSFKAITYVGGRANNFFRGGLPESLRTLGWSDEWSNHGLLQWTERLVGVESKGPEPLETAVASLIAVRAPILVDSELTTMIIWYVPTPELVYALPTRHRAAAQQMMGPAVSRGVRLSRSPKWSRDSDAAETSDSDARQLPGLHLGPTSYTFSSLKGENPLAEREEIPGIRYVDLRLAEAERLGIYRTDTGLTVLMKTRLSRTLFQTALQRFGYDAKEEEPITQFAITFNRDGDVNSLEPRALHADKLENDHPSPLLYTALGIDSRGSHLTSMMAMASNPPLPAGPEKSGFVADLVDSLISSDDGSREIWAVGDASYGSRAHRLLSSLVAVRVYINDDPDQGVVVYWYLPTLMLLDRLPERYRTAIDAEMEIIANARDDIGSSLCARVAGERTFLAVCQGGAGAITFPDVTPNLVGIGGAFKVTFTLTERRSLSASLHDLTGRSLQSLMPTTRQEKGEVNLQLVPDRVEPGPYLLLIKTEKGEHLLRRVMIVE